MKRGQIRRLFVYDLTLGLRQNAAKLVTGVAVLAFLCAMSFVQFSWLELTPDFVGLSASVLHGAAPYLAQQNGDFALPVMWLVLNAYGLFLTCTYPVSDLRANGKYAMMLSSSREKWWFSKCLWVVTNSLLYYGALYLILLIGCLLSGNGIRAVSPDVFEYLDLHALNGGIDIIHIFLLPSIAFCSVALIQAVISLAAGPIVGYVSMIGFLVLSVYIRSPWLIGNYMMLARLSPFVADGLNVLGGYGLSLVVILLTAIAGTRIMKKRNITG